MQGIWAQLMKLYKSLGEEDIIFGLYENISTETFTKDALAAEMEGSYSTALKIYQTATEKLDQQLIRVSTQESDLWENGRLECLMKLTKWDNLAKNTMTEIEDDVRNRTVPILKLFRQKSCGKTNSAIPISSILLRAT